MKFFILKNELFNNYFNEGTKKDKITFRGKVII